MTPAEFRAVAHQIAGRFWKTSLPPMIGKCRTQVWEYANGKRAVPETVVKLMEVLAEKNASKSGD